MLRVCFMKAQFLAGGKHQGGGGRWSILLSTWPWREGTALQTGTAGGGLPSGLIDPEGGEWEMFEGSRDTFQAYWASTS